MRRNVLSLAVPLTMAMAFGLTPGTASASGVGNVAQGTQSDTMYKNSYARAGVTNVFATTQLTSCYTPENPYFRNIGPDDSYDGMSPCDGRATTSENLGPYATQAGSNPGYPAAGPMLVKDHSESDIRVDPVRAGHVIGTSKWFVSAEGYNHINGFYESFDGGKTWGTSTSSICPTSSITTRTVRTTSRSTRTRSRIPACLPR